MPPTELAKNHIAIRRQVNLSGDNLLICSLYPVDKWIIEIDGQDIVEIKSESLIRTISMIFADPYLFDGSIYENIRIGNLRSSKEDIIRVAKLVKIHDFIESIPEKYNTNVGEDGLMLSSGEKQKIALARAVLKDSPIILLDEMTKSIDVDSREAIHEVIKSLKNEKTIIIVTHNASEIDAYCNVIYLGQKDEMDDSITLFNLSQPKISS